MGHSALGRTFVMPWKSGPSGPRQDGKKIRALAPELPSTPGVRRISKQTTDSGPDPDGVRPKRPQLWGRFSMWDHPHHGSLPFENLEGSVAHSSPPLA